MRASVSKATSEIQVSSRCAGVIDHSDAHTRLPMIRFANSTGTPWR